GTVTSGSSAPEPRDVVPGPDEAPQDGAEEDESVPDGPVFEASDRRASIVADHRGVRLRLDDQECEFRWDEIGAVETETARFGKRYTVTVHTDRKSTRLNSSHVKISYAVFCLKKKKINQGSKWTLYAEPQ